MAGVPLIFELSSEGRRGADLSPRTADRRGAELLGAENSYASVKLAKSGRQDGCGRGSGRTVNLREPGPRSPGDLAVTGLAAQLAYQLVHLPQP